MKEVAANSNDFIKMGPGTLYGSINRMLDAGLIREVESKPDQFENGERRRYYKITDLGRSALSSEIQRFTNILRVARKINLGPA